MRLIVQPKYVPNTRDSSFFSLFPQKQESKGFGRHMDSGCPFCCAGNDDHLEHLKSKLDHRGTPQLF
jgi:hypothetical protein